MVLKKRLEYGFNGFQVPTIPRAPRSIRRRALHRKTDEDSQICAFELLASLAGKLLQESESSSASSNASEGNDHPAIGKDVIKQERQDKDKPLKTECFDQGSCERRSIVSESVSQNSEQKFFVKEFPPVENDALVECASIIIKSGCSEKTTGDLKSVICKSKTAHGNFPSKVEGGSPDLGESIDGNVENGFAGRQETEGLETEGLSMANICSSKDPMELCMTFPAPIGSERDLKLPSRRNASFSRHSNGIKLGSRDDGENFSRCNKPSISNNKFKAFKTPPRIGDRRIRKLLTSKYWKAAPKLNDFELSRADGGVKPIYRKRKTSYNRERCHHDSVYKRRKFSDRSSIVTFDGGFSCESVSNSPEKGVNRNQSGSAAMVHGASGVSSSVTAHQASLHSKDSHVKFSIKSFKVPELFIEVPETATVGLLKRTVMEAVTTILGGEIRVGVLLQGKKVRDDNRTLSQTGIGCKGNLDTLGFTLEPSPTQAPPPLCSEDPPFSLPCDAPKLPCDAPQLLTRSPDTSALEFGIPDALPDPLSLTNSGNHVESNHELVSSFTDKIIDKMTDNTLPDSRALVPVPPMSVEALAVVPVNHKIRQSELAQRRTRRPFSVTEVEALVQAVEELGTGRWRDVKLRAFENADHRTYVDLKDKWKTLVHTARISPQQRRGEPVPQELLNRVLAAHAYWCQHQAKQAKQQAGTLKITEAHNGRNGVVEGIQLL